MRAVSITAAHLATSPGSIAAVKSAARPRNVSRRACVGVAARRLIRAVSCAQEGFMDDHIYRVIEIVGTSQKGIDDAVKSAIQRANSTLRNLRWFEVARTSGHIADGKIEHFQVTLKVGFTME